MTVYDRVVCVTEPPFNAVGDGVHDDTAAINAAIAAAGTTLFGMFGNKVFIPRGSYLITAPIVIYNGVHLCGVKQGSQLLMAPTFNDGGKGALYSNTAGQEFTYVSSLRLTGNASATCFAGIYISSWFTNSVVRDVVVESIPGIGIQIDAAGNGNCGPVTIDNCWLRVNHGDNLFITDASGPVVSIGITNCAFENCGSLGVVASKANVHIHATTSGGIQCVYLGHSHFEQGTANSTTHVLCDGAGSQSVTIDTVLLETGDPTHMTAGVSLTNCFLSQARLLVNPNGINPCLTDITAGYTGSSGNEAQYWTQDCVLRKGTVTIS